MAVRSLLNRSDDHDDDETAMTVLSTLSLRERSHPAFVARFASTYAAHRPLIQRILTAGFIAQCPRGNHQQFIRLAHRPRPHPKEKERLASSLRPLRQESRPELLYASIS
jgi:hypothetical protein